MKPLTTKTIINKRFEKTHEVSIDISVNNKNSSGTVEENILFSIELDDGIVPKEIKEQYEDNITHTFDQDTLDSEPLDSDYNTKISFDLTSDLAKDLAFNILDHVEFSKLDKLKTTEKLLLFTRAQLSCAKGEIGRLDIVRHEMSDKLVGLYKLDLIYFEDFEDDVISCIIEGIESFIPFIPEEQTTWLMSLVGGKHQYTHDIAIRCDNFNLSNIEQEFMDALSKQ